MAAASRVSVIILVCVLGALAGIVLGRVLVALLPGLAPVFSPAIDLSFDIQVLHAGFRFNLAGVLGVIGALLVWRRL